MLPIDSLVIDLIFQQGAALKPETLIESLGGKDLVASRKILDPDMHGPQFEMEVSPSMPFRRRGERRLMIIDDSVSPMRKNPRAEAIVGLDLRAERDRLISVCQALPIRLGRLNALGSWGDAVLVARSARDLRGIALLSWVLDPTVDVDGNQRAGRLTQQEFEAKIVAFEKRLEELDDQAILTGIHGATVERRGELIIVDALEPNGNWDVRKSMVLEAQLAAIDSFSLIPGAPSSKRGKLDRPQSKIDAEPEAALAPESTEPVEPLTLAEVGGRLLLIFPASRFNLDVAAALGKRDYSSLIVRGDNASGAMKDRIYRDGAEFVAPLEFLSEVFVDGKPLSRPQFDQNARELAKGIRAMDVHCPRFGPVVLIDIAGKGRYITSAMQAVAEVVKLLV